MKMKNIFVIVKENKNSRIFTGKSCRNKRYSTILRYFTHTYIRKIEKQRSMDWSDPFRFEFKILSSAMQNVAKRTRYEQFGRS